MKFLPDTKDLINVAVVGVTGVAFTYADQKIAESLAGSDSEFLRNMADDTKYESYILPIVYVIGGLFLMGKLSGVLKWVGFGIAVYGITEIARKIMAQFQSEQKQTA